MVTVGIIQATVMDMVMATMVVIVVGAVMVDTVDTVGDERNEKHMKNDVIFKFIP